MAAAAGNFSLHQGAQVLNAPAAPMAGTNSGRDDSAGSSSSSGTISANDFLTLLVTEMQNQDPTTQTDPNEYINQLVAVNSLEQLIGINETLTTALGTQTETGSAPPSTQAAIQLHAAPATAGEESSVPAGGQGQSSPGNLSVPAASSAADRVAHALDGQSH